MRGAPKHRGAAPIAVPPLSWVERRCDQCENRPGARTNVSPPVVAETTVTFGVGLEGRIRLIAGAGLAAQLVAEQCTRTDSRTQCQRARHAGKWHFNCRICRSETSLGLSALAMRRRPARRPSDS